MIFRRTVTAHAWIICLSGIVFTGWGPALLGAVRVVEEPGLQRRIERVLVESHLVVIAVVTAQQIAIWETPLGWATVGLFLLVTAAYVALLYVPRWRIRVPA